MTDEIKFRGATVERWAELADTLSKRTAEIFSALAGLRSVVATGGKGFADQVHITRADRILAQAPDHFSTAETELKLMRAADPLHEHEGTAEGLQLVATMIETWAPETFPVNENGQIHFGRAMLDSAAGEIRAYLARQAAQDPPRDGEGNRPQDGGGAGTAQDEGRGEEAR